MIENRKRALVRAVVAVAVGSCALPALAADGTWIGASGSNWSDPGNWAGGIVPGSVGGPYTNTDTANFVNLTGTPNVDPIDAMLINIDAGRSIGNMFVDNLNSISVVIGTNAGEALRLTSGGTTSTGTSFTRTSAGPGNVNFTIAAPLIVEGNTYNFVSNAPAGRQGGIQITGPLTFTGAGAKTIVLGGTNNDGNQSQNQINSALSDSGGGPVGIVKNGTGTWELNALSGFASYSGDTVVNGGFLRLRGVDSGGVLTASGVSTNSRYISNGGTLRFSTPGLVAKSIVLNDPTLTTAGLNLSSSSTFPTVKNETGPGLELNFNVAPTSQISARVDFTGTTAEQGGIVLNNGGNAIGPVDFGSTSAHWNLGSVLRPVNIARGNEENSYDARFRGQLNGTGGFVKLGAGRLRIDNTVNPITGTIEVREGTLLMNNPNAFTNLPALLISGGSMNINGTHTQRFGSVTLTKGSITQSNNNTGIALLSPTITFNPAAGDTASIAPIITDDPSGPTSVIKNGQGTGILTNVNSNYTGTTTVNAGTLLVNGAHTGGAAYSVAGGRLGGTGTISATVNVTGGRVSPGQNVGTLTIDGPLNIAGPGGVRVEIESASSFDQLVVNGAKSLGGSMEIDLLAGYNPLPAYSFTVVSGAGARSGTFSTNPWGLITVLGGGKAFLPQYGATDVVLTDFARVGDVNRDGAVNNLDIASFVGLLTGNPAAGSVGFAGDVNGDGVVNNLDIAPFVALLTGGRPVGDDPEFAPLLALVPEPASLSLLALGGLTLGRRRRA